MELQDTMGYANPEITAVYVERANEAQAPRPVNAEAFAVNMGYASAAITQQYLESVKRFNNDRLIETAQAVTRATTLYNSQVFENWAAGNLAREDYERAKAEYMAEIKALLSELRSID